MSRRRQVHTVTQARPPMSEDISHRQRRYLLMMGIRAVCFLAAIIMFANHLGWISAIPAVGAIVIPYFAVVYANGGREPTNVRGFREYHPNLPAQRDSTGDEPGSTGDGPESNGHSGKTGSSHLG